MQDAWRAYMELALGLTEASRKRATKAVKGLVGKGGATAEQLQALAEDLTKMSTVNREALTKLVRYELDRALGAVGVATSEEVADLTARVRDLEQRQEAEARAAAGAPERLPAKAPAQPHARQAPVPAAGRAVAKKAVAKKTVAKKTVANKAAANKAAANKAVAKRTARDAGTGAG